MKINHIALNSFSWASYWNNKNKESSSEIYYELRIYRHIEYSYYGYRYQLVSYKNKRYYSRNILTTDSKEEMKMTLDLMGLRIERITIIMEKNLNNEMFLPCSVIDLI